MAYINTINTNRFTIRSRGLNLRCQADTAKMQSIQAQAKSAIVSRYVIKGTGLLGVQTIGREFVLINYWTITYELAIKFKSVSSTDLGWLHVVFDRGHAQRIYPGAQDQTGGEIAASEIFPNRPAVPATIQTVDCRSFAPAGPVPLDGHGGLNEGQIAGLAEQKGKPAPADL